MRLADLYHNVQPHEVIAHLVRQLSANIVGCEDGLSEKAIKALNSYSHEGLASILQDLCLHHVLMDVPVIIVVDNMHLAEQRILGLVINELRKKLQPWFYNLKIHWTH